MEVHFSPEQQGELTEIATKAGTAPERQWQMLLPVTSMKKPILAPVEKGIAAAERGEFIEEEEMDARIKSHV
jgi:predicted transcriptional regulator